MPEEEPGLGQWEAVSLGAVRCLSDSGQNTGPSGLSGWARGGVERGGQQDRRRWFLKKTAL